MKFINPILATLFLCVLSVRPVAAQAPADTLSCWGPGQSWLLESECWLTDPQLVPLLRPSYAKAQHLREVRIVDNHHTWTLQYDVSGEVTRVAEKTISSGSVDSLFGVQDAWMRVPQKELYSKLKNVYTIAPATNAPEDFHAIHTNEGMYPPFGGNVFFRWLDPHHLLLLSPDSILLGFDEQDRLISRRLHVPLHGNTKDEKTIYRYADASRLPVTVSDSLRPACTVQYALLSCYLTERKIPYTKSLPDSLRPRIRYGLTLDNEPLDLLMPAVRKEDSLPAYQKIIPSEAIDTLIVLHGHDFFEVSCPLITRQKMRSYYQPAFELRQTVVTRKKIEYAVTLPAAVHRYDRLSKLIYETDRKGRITKVTLYGPRWHQPDKLGEAYRMEINYRSY